MASTQIVPVRLRSCSCGKHIQQSLERCTSCSRQFQRRVSPRARPLTPPPTTPETTRLSQATIALNDAFASDDDVPRILPKSIYRMPERPSATPSRATSAPPSGVSSPSTDATHVRRTSDESMSAQSPGRSPNGRAYAPMAAAFVRVAREVQMVNSAPNQLNRESSSGSNRPGLEAELRLFDGPA